MQEIPMMPFEKWTEEPLMVQESLWKVQEVEKEVEKEEEKEVETEEVGKEEEEETEVETEVETEEIEK